MHEHAGELVESLVNETDYYLRDFVTIVKKLLAIVV